MKYYEKIKKFRLDRGLSVRDLYQKISDRVGPKEALSMRTINRIEEGKPYKFSSIKTICDILKIPLAELFKDTESEECVEIKRKDREKGGAVGGIQFDGKAGMTIINNPNQSFLGKEYILLPSGQTPLDRAPKNRGKYEKMVYVVMGRMECIVEEDRFTFKGGDSLCFDSTRPHYFKNTSKAKCKFIVVENPGRY